MANLHESHENKDRKSLSKQEILSGKLRNVELFCEPTRPPSSWNEFIQNHPPFSIALDGYINSKPIFDKNGNYLNLDHHAEVDRLATRATCGQTLMVVRQGLFDTFRDASGAKAKVWVNDCDQDVCLSWFLLKYGKFTETTKNPLLDRLVNITDRMDTTSGMDPFLDEQAEKEMSWVYDPYRQFRLSGSLDQKDPVAYGKIIQKVEERIVEYLSGKGKLLSLDTRFNRIGGGEDWAMVEEIGAQARTGMLKDGIRAFVSVRPRSNDRWTYTLGRLSQFINFDIPKLIHVLNAIEGAQVDKWGGSGIIGGSPRVNGSKISPTDLIRIINEFQMNQKIANFPKKN